MQKEKPNQTNYLSQIRWMKHIIIVREWPLFVWQAIFVPIIKNIHFLLLGLGIEV